MQPTWKRSILHRYDASCFDSDYCLKPPLLLWAAVAYLARGFLLPFMGGITSMSGSGDAASMTRGHFQLTQFIPAGLALLIPLLFMLRKPNAPAWIRRAWANGALLMSAAALVDFGISAWDFGSQSGFQRDSLQTTLGLLACVADLYFLVYVLGSRYARDTFRDFPVTG